MQSSHEVSWTLNLARKKNEIRERTSTFAPQDQHTFSHTTSGRVRVSLITAGEVQVAKVRKGNMHSGEVGKTSVPGTKLSHGPGHAVPGNARGLVDVVAAR